MGFAAQDLSVLGYANGFTHWHYRSIDPLTDLLQPAYFAGARELLRAGDQMTVNLVSPDRADIASFAVVSLEQSGGVRLALLMASDPARPALKAA
jgi:hypothetical protein